MKGRNAGPGTRDAGKNETHKGKMQHGTVVVIVVSGWAVIVVMEEEKEAVVVVVKILGHSNR